MTLAALIISILALIAATASAYYTRQQATGAKRQATATEGTFQIESERRKEERQKDYNLRAPRFTASFLHTAGVFYKLKITYHGPSPLETVIAKLEPNQPLVFMPAYDDFPLKSLDQVFPEGFSYNAADHKEQPLEPDTHMMLSMQRVADGPVYRLQLTAGCWEQDGTQWDAIKIVATPSETP
jgi:type II secretory pathway pseudopilin PulG